jgi:hypothetical protein
MTIVSEAYRVLAKNKYDAADFSITQLPSTPDHPAGFSVFHAKSHYQHDYLGKDGETALQSFDHALKRGDYRRAK